MKAVKGNKVYVVDNTTKARYLAEGFDITDDSGSVVETGKGKAVPYEKYQGIKKQLEVALATQQETMTALKNYAQAAKIPIGNASTVKGILTKLTEAAGGGN